MNHSSRNSEVITERQARLIIDGAAHAYRIGRPLNRAITVHLRAAGATGNSHGYITDLFSHYSDSLRSSATRQACYVWTLEGGDKGLHLHAAIHVPPSRFAKLLPNLRQWSEQITGAKPGSKAIDVTPIDFADSPYRNVAYLGADFGKPENRSGLKGWIGYMLKGIDRSAGRRLGVWWACQGKVPNKRVGVSQSLGPTARKNFVVPPLSEPMPGQPRFRRATRQAFIERMLGYSGWVAGTDYAPDEPAEF